MVLFPHNVEKIKVPLTEMVTLMVSVDEAQLRNQFYLSVEKMETGHSNSVVNTVDVWRPKSALKFVL